MAGIPLNGKAVNLRQLLAELTAAGISVPFGLGADTNVYTYNSVGVPADLPPGSDVVVAAHIAVDPVAAAHTAVVAAAQSAVGVQAASLTANQQRALLLCLAYKAGAIDATLTVLPLNQWLT